MNLRLLLLCFLSFSFSAPALAVDLSDGRRLIETGHGVRKWMSEEEVVEFARAMDERGRCGQFMDVTDHPETSTESYRIFSSFYAGRGLRAQERVEPLLKELSTERLTQTISRLTSFKNRFYKSKSGKDAALWIRDEFLRIAARRTDVEVRLQEHSFLQPSVIATIRGKGPHSRERIVVGGHEDSINLKSSSIPADAVAPGADDNASGVATVLEIFRVLIESGMQWDRTLEFMTFAGEERGLLGSQDIAQDYKRRGVPVLGVMQLDMTFYPGKSRTITLINDQVDADLTHFTGKLLDAYVKVPWVEDPCGYGCSDHASWSRAGFASTFPFESSIESHNPDIHTQFDTLDRLDAAFGLHFAKLGLAFLVESASEN